MLSLVREFAHQVAIVPLLVVAIMARRGQPIHTGHWFIAASLACSWVADWIGHWVNVWYVVAAFGVTQYALVFLAFAIHPLAHAVHILIIAAVAAVSVMLGGIEGPTAAVTLMGGAQVAGLTVWKYGDGQDVVADERWIAAGLFVYFGAGALLWLMFTFSLSLWTWLGYQACRVVGIGCVAYGIVRTE